jgi:hypothetical protein
VKCRPLVIVVLFAVLLSACGSERTSGNTRLKPEIVASIQKGVTTREQVRSLLGAPQSVKTQVPITSPSGPQTLPAKVTATEIWAFWTTRDSKPGIAAKMTNSSKPRHTSLTILIYFDVDGIVLDCQIEEGRS